MSGFYSTQHVRAAKLQRALSRSLGNRDPLLDRDEFEKRGIEDYRREFGHAISPRHFRRLIARTVERDGGARQWARLHLYLCEKPAKTSQHRSAAVLEGSKFYPIQEAIAICANPTAPTEPELEYIWVRILELHQEEIDRGASRKATTALLTFLLKAAPFLANSRDAIQKAFRRRYKRWMDGGRRVSAITDQRKNSGHRSLDLSKEDRDKIVAHAVLNCGGRVSQAYRELSESGMLSENLLGSHLQNPQSKSYVPHRIRNAVKHEVRLLGDEHHGPRQSRLNGAFLTRDWSGVRSGDWYQADDCTLPIYFYVPDGDGWFTLIRGQFLLMVDVRTTCILGYSLLAEANYNARVIRSLITKTCDEHGLPRRGFYFENGVWKNARILKGDPKADPLSWAEVETGLRGLGLEFRHARLPRAKVIEGVLGRFQNLLESDPGYAGRDERHDRFERVQKLMQEVRRKNVHPAEHFYSYQQWDERLGELCGIYNASEQNGEMLPRLSPDEAFRQFDDPSNPQSRLGPDCRYLLADHRRPIRITRNGITLRFGKQAFNYRNEDTGRLMGQTVLAWFDPEVPELLTVTDMQRKNPFCVERSQAVPAMDASAGLLKQEGERIAAHQSFAKVRYRILKATHGRSFRPNLLDRKTKELGAEIGRQRSEALNARNHAESRRQRVHQDARVLGIPVEALPTLSPDVERGMALLKKAGLGINQESGQ